MLPAAWQMPVLDFFTAGALASCVAAAALGTDFGSAAVTLRFSASMATNNAVRIGRVIGEFPVGRKSSKQGQVYAPVTTTSHHPHVRPTDECDKYLALLSVRTVKRFYCFVKPHSRICATIVIKPI